MADDVYLSEGQLTTDDGIVSPTVGSLTVRGDINVSGAMTLGGVQDRTSLESLGAQIPQTAAAAIEASYITFIKDAGAASPSTATRDYLGGDVTDMVYVPGSGDLFIIGADWFAGPQVDATTERYLGDALPVRNGVILQSTAGDMTTGQQLYASGTAGVWLDAVNQGGIAAGRHWWPIGLIDDDSTYRVACWRVQDGLGSPHGQLQEVDIVTLVFGGYQSHLATGLAAATDKFWVSGMWRDTSHTYIYGMEFVPDFDARVSGGSQDNYVLGDPENHYSLTRLARVANGSLLTMASWTFWNGSTWVAGAANAVPLADVEGNPIRGDAGIMKITSTHYVLAAHALMDTHLDVYKASSPQGPWTRISRVPLPGQGHKVNGDDTYQVGQLVKILPTQAHIAASPPPAEHRIAIISRNTIVPTVGYSAEEAFTSRNIRRYAPQFAVIPTI